MRPITEAPDLKGKRALVRCDLDVLAGNNIENARLIAAIPTLRYLQEEGATIIIIGHAGRPKGRVVEGLRFAPIEARLHELAPDLKFEMRENLRFDPREEDNDKTFARELASLGDLYVNEAFGNSHRKHASMIGISKFLPSYAGLQLMKEVEGLSKAFHPPHPFLIILGGVKMETRLPLVEKFSNIADTIFIGGAMAAKASEMGLGENHKVLLPHGDLLALDSNAETLEILKQKISEAKFIIWNGPLGQYETGHTQYTHELARALSEAEAEVIVGGGDTIEAIKDLNILDKFSFISTGGGAMLDFLAMGTLPGIEALNAPHP